MANEKISQMPAISSFATGDLLPIVDVSEISASDKNKSVTFGELFRNVLGGSASAPSIAFTGDQNTGIYSPGADQVAVATNGTGRLFVNSSGRIFAGPLTSPTSLNDGAGSIFTPSLYATTTSGVAGVAAYVEDGVNNRRAGLFVDQTNAIWGLSARWTSGEPAFVIRSGNTERLRITSAGLVGIGTSIPGQLLEIAATSNPQMRFTDTGDYYYDIGITSSNKFSISPAGSPALTVVAAGNVGIGATVPPYRLTVKDTADQIHITNPTAGDANSDGFTIGLSGSDAQLINRENGAIILYQNSGEAARIDSSKRLLVGTSSTSSVAKLQVQGYVGDNTGVGLVELQAGSATPTSGTGLGRIDFSDNASRRGAVIAAERDGGTWSASSQPGRLVFSTTADGASSPTERMRIAQTGNISFFNTGFVFPNTDNATSIGGATNRWAAVYAVNGTIQTSDGREKTEVHDASLGTDFIKSLRPVSYKWIEGGKRDTGERDKDSNYIYESVPGERTHWGFIAQEVKQVVDAAGVDFGGWVLTDKDDPDSQQALRYDQFIAPLTKALQETMAELEALKAEVTALKAQ